MLFSIIVLILLLLLASAGYYFARVAVYPKVLPVEVTYQREFDAGKILAGYKNWPSQEIRIRSPYGYDLFAVYHPVPGSHKTVVITHGITWSLYGSVKYARLFYERGFNVLLYDLRNHGRSGGKNTTFGYYEKHDLKNVVDWAISQLDTGGCVGTMGESLGAGTTIQHAGIDDRIAFAIADCPFSDVTELFEHRLKEDFHLPAFPLIPVASLFIQWISGMRMKDTSPIRFVAGIKTPMFFIHGQNDRYILPKMSVDLYNAKRNGIRKLYLAPNAGHAEAYWNNQEEYNQKIDEFLAEIGLAE